MKKLFALLLALAMVLSLTACGGQKAPDDQQSGEGDDAAYPACFDGMDQLIAAAQAEGELAVYGSCEEAYLAAACRHFEELFGIKTTCRCLPAGQALSRIESENGSPSADVWFGGDADPYSVCAEEGLLESYAAVNASHLTDDAYRDADGCWYGIYKDVLGFMVNTKYLALMEIEAPQDWDDLLKEEYKDLVWLPSYRTDGAAKLVVNTMIQRYGHDEGIRYLTELDKNVDVYAESDSDISRSVGTGECVIGIGLLHDGIAQIVDNGCTNMELIIPSGGASLEVGATAILKGAAHPNAARLWIEYALSPECVELAAQNGSYQLPVIDNAQQPSQAADLGLDPNDVMEYDFEDARENTAAYVEEVVEALTDSDSGTEKG